MASNETIAAKFRDVGLVDVVVTGSGADRVACGMWPGPDTDVELPSQIVSVELRR
jgi:hypothetical protein